VRVKIALNSEFLADSLNSLHPLP